LYAFNQRTLDGEQRGKGVGGGHSSEGENTQRFGKEQVQGNKNEKRKSKRFSILP